MRLVRFGPVGAERPGALDADDRVHDLSGVVDTFGPAQLAPDALDRLRAVDLAQLPIVDGERLGPPITGTTNFHAIGFNYAMHVGETAAEIPTEPLVFTKATSCISGPFDPIEIPPGSQTTDWEVELGVVIGTPAFNVSQSDAPAHIAGYLVVDDVSDRDFQANRGGQWVKGKSAPTFGPIGPWFVTADEVPDPQALDLWLDVDDERMQSANTKDMIFGVYEIVSYLSIFMRLMPGDIIATGTPAGIGGMMNPPRYLQPGEVVRAGVAGLGEQRTLVSGSSGGGG